MVEKFVLSERDFGKLFVMMLLASGLFGLSGLIGMLVMQWITRQRYAQDRVDKHGISEITASRLGGVFIVAMSLALLLVYYIDGQVFSNVGPLGIHPWGWFAFSLCTGLGLIEDLRNNALSPRIRLILLMAIFAVTFYYWPWLVPNRLGFAMLDNLMSLPLLGWLLSVLFCVGFLNAVNMADGANGLMPGIAFITFATLSLVIGALIWEVMVSVTGIFLLFNVISGRLFLGDAGAYGLGTMLVLGGLYAVNAGWVSPWFMAVMVAYPCIEILTSMVRRYMAGRSLFLPDNDHLHNRIHERLQSRSKSKILANSGTGLMITLASAGIGFAGYYWALLAATDHRWFWVFCFQCVAYGMVFVSLGDPAKRVMQPVLPD